MTELEHALQAEEQKVAEAEKTRDNYRRRLDEALADAQGQREAHAAAHKGLSEAKAELHQLRSDADRLERLLRQADFSASKAQSERDAAADNQIIAESERDEAVDRARRAEGLAAQQATELTDLRTALKRAQSVTPSPSSGALPAAAASPEPSLAAAVGPALAMATDFDAFLVELRAVAAMCRTTIGETPRVC